MQQTIDQIHAIIENLSIDRFSSRGSHVYSLLFEFSKVATSNPKKRKNYFKLTKIDLKKFSHLSWFSRVSIDDKGLFYLDSILYDRI